MCHPPETFERRDVVYAHLRHHGQMFPVRPNCENIPGTHSISRYYIKAPLLVQGGMILMEAEKIS